MELLFFLGRQVFIFWLIPHLLAVSQIHWAVEVRVLCHNEHWLVSSFIIPGLMLSEFCQFLLTLNALFCLQRCIKWQFHLGVFLILFLSINQFTFSSNPIWKLFVFHWGARSSLFTWWPEVSLPFSSSSRFLCSLDLHRDYFCRHTDQRFTIKAETVYEKFCHGKMNLPLAELLFLKN